MPTLADYMTWLRGIGGKCKNGIGADDDIGMVPVIKLTAPNGRSVIFGGGDQHETLSIYTIEYLDRRLQVVSPFKSVLSG